LSNKGILEGCDRLPMDGEFIIILGTMDAKSITTDGHKSADFSMLIFLGKFSGLAFSSCLSPLIFEALILKAGKTAKFSSPLIPKEGKTAKISGPIISQE
jgi:hypothetical protein